MFLGDWIGSLFVFPNSHVFTLKKSARLSFIRWNADVTWTAPATEVPFGLMHFGGKRFDRWENAYA